MPAPPSWPPPGKVGDSLTLKPGGKPVIVRIAGELFAPTPAPTLFTSWHNLGGAAAGLTISSYDIDVQPGTSVQAPRRQAPLGAPNGGSERSVQCCCGRRS